MGMDEIVIGPSHSCNPVSFSPSPSLCFPPSLPLSLSRSVSLITALVCACTQDSDVDIEVDEGTGDDEYLRLLSERLPKLVDQVCPDLIFYQVQAGQGGGRSFCFVAGVGLCSTACVGHHNEAGAKAATIMDSCRRAFT